MSRTLKALIATGVITAAGLGAYELRLHNNLRLESTYPTFSVVEKSEKGAASVVSPACFTARYDMRAYEGVFQSMVAEDRKEGSIFALSRKSAEEVVEAQKALNATKDELRTRVAKANAACTSDKVSFECVENKK